MTLRLLNVSAGQAQDEFASIKNKITIGRNAEFSGLQITNSAVSSLHGEFFLIEGAWFYRDLESSNGSYLNGIKLISNSWYQLRVRDSLMLANTEFFIEIDDYDFSVARIFVFKNNKPLAMRNLTSKGFVIGFSGSNDNLQLQVEKDSSTRYSVILDEAAALHGEYDTTQDRVFKNGVVVDALHSIDDGDRIEIQDCLVIFEFPDKFKLSMKVADSDSNSSDLNNAISGIWGWKDPATEEKDEFQSKEHLIKRSKFGMEGSSVTDISTVGLRGARVDSNNSSGISDNQKVLFALLALIVLVFLAILLVFLIS